MSYASTAGWSPGDRSHRHHPRRGWEIAGIVLGFIFAWPLALAYVAWKVLGYPVPKRMNEFMTQNFDFRGFDAARFSCGKRAGKGFERRWDSRRGFSTGNLAFDEYRQNELNRLEEERRKLDEEAKAFSEFVEDLKRAKDREEFDAFVARRRAAPPSADTNAGATE